MGWLLTAHVRRYHQHYHSSGHVWQGRFRDLVIQEDDHLLTVLRYIERNPVRACLVERAQDWPWSSLRAHLAERDDGLVRVSPLIARLGRITALVDTEPEASAVAALRAAESTGRPLGADDFVADLERRLGRKLRRQKPGRKAREVGD